MSNPPDYIYRCPCGSGKEPQDCCFKNAPPNPQEPRFPIARQNQIVAAFSNFQQIHLISALAGLQIFPKNHSYLPRLCTATQIACSLEKGGSESLEKLDLEQLLTDFFPANGDISKFEDPPEGLFTENIEFRNGNNIIYSGISADGGHILRTILRSFSFNEQQLSNEFFHEVVPKTLALLLISNEVALRAGHHRYMDSEIQLWGPIKIPGKDEFDRLQKAVIFSKKDLHKIFSPYGFDEGILDSFIMTVTSPKFIRGAIHDNPLYERPIIRIGDTYILAVPAAIAGALRHFILMTAKKQKKIRQLITLISKAYWVAVQVNLDLLGFKPLKINLPKLNEDLNLYEIICEFDTDKIAYIQFVVDDGDSYKEINPIKIWKNHRRKTKIDARYQEIIAWLQSQKKTEYNYVFFIAILGIIGRPIEFRYSKEPPNVTFLCLSTENLEVLARIEKCDCLQLWKFVNHMEEVSSYHKVATFSVLDLYEFYLRSHVPREVWRGNGEVTIAISPGSGQRLRIESVKKTDIHAAIHGHLQGWITVTKFSEDSSDPIYVPEGTLFQPFQLLVEKYPQPIWIEVLPESREILKATYPFYHQFIDVFSYWIWQLTDSLYSHLEPLGNQPIHIGIDYENFSENGFIMMEDEESLRAPLVIFDRKTRTLRFIINSSILSAIEKKDNSGERCLVDTLLREFGRILEDSNLPNTLDEETCKTILDIHIPYGTKKKLFHFNSKENAAVDPRWLPLPRLLQDHDLIEQLSGLQTDLENIYQDYPPQTEEQKRLFFYHHSVQIYLNRLKMALAEYVWTDLLSEIIRRNEAFLTYQAKLDHNIVSSVQLYSDLSAEVRHLTESRELMDNSSIALRTLIEIIAAEPPQGNKSYVSLTDFDSLLSLSHHFSHIGIAGDTVHYELDSPGNNNSPLSEEDDSGTIRNRVGIFFENKYREGLEAKFEDFKRISPADEEARIVQESDFDQNLQNAFRAEFGLPLSQILRFFACVIDLGFELETSSPHLPLSDFKKRVQSVLQWSDEDLDQAIKQFSLVPRSHYETAPDGYIAEKDIFPWVYNRRISYIVRPLIIGPEPIDDPLIFWGPRHVDKIAHLLIDNVLSGRYLREDKTTLEMKTFISQMINKSSKGFEKSVKEWFEQNTPWIIDSRVLISPGGKLLSSENLGDIDVLAIDTSSKTLYSIECKQFNFARNPREISREIRKLLGIEGDSTSLMERHLRRDAWLKSNIDLIRATYGIPEGNFTVQSLFIVSEELATQYLKEMPMPVIAFSRLRREGIVCLLQSDFKN